MLPTLGQRRCCTDNQEMWRLKVSQRYPLKLQSSGPWRRVVWRDLEKRQRGFLSLNLREGATIPGFPEMLLNLYYTIGCKTPVLQDGQWFSLRLLLQHTATHDIQLSERTVRSVQTRLHKVYGSTPVHLHIHVSVHHDTIYENDQQDATM